MIIKKLGTAIAFVVLAAGIVSGEPDTYPFEWDSDRPPQSKPDKRQTTTEESIQPIIPPEPLDYVLGSADQLEIIFFREPSLLQKEYRIHAGDEIKIDFPFYPELDVQVSVPPDGKIMFRKIGEIVVANLTTQELKEKLQDAYSEMLTRPDLVISLIRFYSSSQEFFGILDLKAGRHVKEVSVRSDGRISLPLIEDLNAEGLTSQELANEIQSRYSKKFPELRVSLNVLEEGSKKILVMGQVARAGVYQLTSYMTPLEAISTAGGPLPKSKLGKVLVIRKNRYNRPDLYQVNISNTLSYDKESNLPFYLQPYDIVFVRKTKAAKVEDALKQVYSYVPHFVSVGFGYALRYETNPSPD
ncbi:polysaccharide biosynthesis/export family protein [Acidobacteriota bacterium]